MKKISAGLSRIFRLLTCLVALCAVQRAAADFDAVGYVLEPKTPGIGNGGVLLFQADLNADGRQDVISYYTGVGLYVQLSNGVTDLRQKPFADAVMVSSLTLDHLRIADLDGDGYPDLLASRSQYPANDQIYWLRNLCGETGSVSFESTPRVIAEPSNSVQALFTVDLDRDGALDVVSAVNYGAESFNVHANRLSSASHDFAPAALLFNNGRYVTGSTAVFADIDGDGDTDVATTLMLAGGVETVLWMENQITAVSGYGLNYYPSLAGPQLLPTTQNAPSLAMANIGGELWFRFFRSASAVETYRESSFPGRAAEFAELRSLMESFGNGPTTPDATLRNRILKLVARITNYRTGSSISFVEHKLHAAYVPGTIRYYSPQQILAADLDGDGDLDLFTTYTESGYTQNGWFENRLNEPGVNTFSPLQVMQLESYGGNARIADLDGNGRPDLLYRASYFELRVLYDFKGLRDPATTSWTELVRKQATGEFSTSFLNDYLPMDVDGDGDQDIVGAAVNYQGTRLLISENRRGQPRARFERNETELVTNLRVGESAPWLRVEDRNGDGAPDLSLSSTWAFRNDYGKAPSYAFVQDTTLGTFLVAPAADQAFLAAFDTWLSAQPWRRVETVLDRQLVDVDGDGDLDVVMLHGIYDMKASISWFENLSGLPGVTPSTTFRGPFGITENVDYAAKMVCSDIDGDGDVDVLATGLAVRNGVMYRRINLFENTTKPADLIRRMVEGQDGFLRNSIASNRFSAKLQSSTDLNWSTGETTVIPAADLRNSAAMKKHMRWLEPGTPQRFYRMVYSLDN